MKSVYRLLFVVICLSSFIACKQKQEPNLEKLIQNSEFSQAEFLLSKKIGESRNDSIQHKKYIIQLETLSRLRKEFPYKRADVKEQLKPYYPEVSDEQLDNWEAAKQLEMRVIDGEKRYFSRAVGNLFRLNPDAKKWKAKIDGNEGTMQKSFEQQLVEGYFEKNIAGPAAFDQHKLKLTYSVSLDADAVPTGEIVRCWLPYPRTGLTRQPEAELLETSESTYILAPPETLQRSIYMEKPAVAGEPTKFSVSYMVELAAQWFNVKPGDVKPYDTASEIYKTYTAEQKPQIVFTENVRAMAEEIVGEEKNPVEKVRLLFYWINDHIPWAGALEYSVMDCIPEYVLENRHGDCGMQTFLFLSMARSLGIPCKWQSGWYLFPNDKNLHDWAEVYYEGVGWVPLDQSFGLMDSEDIRVKEFYMKGLDSYRLVINDAVSAEFYPKKKYYRSEPYDFQRGELEWKGGNLYFDTWDYHMEVEYIQN